MKISVLTPSYNSKMYISKAIQSVLDQDDPNYEHIIMDGGSTDGTKDILASFGHLQWVSEKDKGQSDAMNKAFELSSGDIVVYLNADDYFNPGVFKAVRKAFEENDVDLVLGDIQVLYANSPGYTNRPETELKKILHYQKFQFPYNPVGYFYRREIQEKIGPFPLQNHLAMDYWFLLRAYEYAKKLKLDLIFGCFINHGDNKTSNSLEDNCYPVAYEFCRDLKPGYLPLFWVRYHFIILFRILRNPRTQMSKMLYVMFFSKKYTVAEYKKYGLKKLLRSQFFSTKK